MVGHLLGWSCAREADLDIHPEGLILMLPMYNVWKLQMPTHRKVAVISIFLLGGLVTVTGIIRLHFLTLTYASLEYPLFNDISCKFTCQKCSRSISPDKIERQLRPCLLLVDH